MIAIDPKYNPSLMTDINPNTVLGPGVTVGKFLVGARHGLSQFNYLSYNEKLERVRNLMPQVELINSVNGRYNQFPNHRLSVSEGLYFGGEGETVGGINTYKEYGRAVVYTLYGRDGKIDLKATYDLAVFWRNNFNYDTLILSYDTINPDDSLHAEIIVVMPPVPEDYNVTFSNSVSTYFNNKEVFADQLTEITL